MSAADDFEHLTVTLGAPLAAMRDCLPRADLLASGSDDDDGLADPVTIATDVDGDQLVACAHRNAIVQPAGHDAAAGDGNGVDAAHETPAQHQPTGNREYQRQKQDGREGKDHAILRVPRGIQVSSDEGVDARRQHLARAQEPTA